MKPNNLLLRCYAKNIDNQWSAVCLDLCLATQADTFEEARQKLEAQISEYVYDAIAGEDAAYAGDLLNRKAPLGQWIEYYWYHFLVRVVHAKDGFHKLFNETLPLVPVA